MSTLRIKQLKEDRARAHSAAIAFLKKEKLTVEDRSAFDKAMNEVDSLGAEIRRLEGNTNSVRIERRTNTEHAIAFHDFLRNGSEMRESSKKTLREYRDFFCATELHKLSTALRRRCRKIFLQPLAPGERVELIARGWRALNQETPVPEDFVSAVHDSGLDSPALILNALDNYAAGTPALEAVACEQQPGTEPSQKPRRQRAMSVDLNRAIALRKEGKSFTDIGFALGASSATVWLAFKRAGQATERIKAPNNLPRGYMPNGRTTLRFEIDQAIALRNAGHSWRSVGRVLGTSGANVWRACKYRGFLTGRA